MDIVFLTRLLTEVLVVTNFLEFGKALDSYQVAKDKVKLLERIPLIADDPIQEILNFLDKFVTSIGIQHFFNGSKKTNTGWVDVPVRLRQPPISNALHYHYYSLATLCESSLERWDCHYCKVLGTHIQLLHLYSEDTYHTRSTIALDNKRGDIVLTIRAGYNAGNALTTLQVVLQQLDGDTSDIKIHSGYIRAALVHYDIVVKKIARLVAIYPSHTVVVTGYSLGGSIASVMTFLFKFRNAFPVTELELYTYGESRVGNRAFVDYFNNMTITVARVVNQDDFIVRVNPAALGYYHHQNELFLTDDGAGNRTARYCSTKFYEDPNCAQGRGASLFIIQPALAVIDHLTYFGIDPSKCLLNSPIEFFLQAFWQLRPLIPKGVLEQLPSFAINTTAVLEFRSFVTAGLRNLYKTAIKSETYE